MKHLVRITLPAAALLLAAASARADWPLIHRTADNNGVVPISTAGSPLAATPRWASTATDYAPVRPIVAGGRVFAVAVSDGGTPFNPAGDSIRVRALNEGTGAQLWQSVALDAGASVANESLSSLAVDTAEGAVYFASGESLQKLDAATGSLLWSSKIDATLTAPGRAYGIVNSTPTLGAGMIFIQTTDFRTNPSQILAFSSTGALAWAQPTSGWGAMTPLFADLGPGQQYIYHDTRTTGGGLQCRNALTGALVWDHATVAAPWVLAGSSGFDGIWGEPILAGGALYVFNYEFLSAGRLAKIDAATGEAAWVVPTISTDTAPVMVGGVLYAIGQAGGGDTSLVAYNPATGGTTATVNLNASVYRNYIAASNDRLYFALSGVGLRGRDLSGTVVGPTIAGTAGPVTLDDAGNVYTYSSGALVSFQHSASVADWVEF